MGNGETVCMRYKVMGTIVQYNIHYSCYKNKISHTNAIKIHRPIEVFVSVTILKASKDKRAHFIHHKLQWSILQDNIFI